MNQVVVIEDNPELLEFISEVVKSKLSMTASAFTSGVKALAYLEHTKPSLVLIDLQLEDIRGETICAEVRKRYLDLPIIILTGEKNTDSIVTCLNLGADDYVTKPFNVDELVARMAARMRVNRLGTNTHVFSVKDIVLNPETLEAKRGEVLLDLTAREFELLRYFLSHKGLILTRDKILAAVWGYRDIVDTRVVDVHVGKLRRKISPKSLESVIKTVRGFGYKMSE